LIWLVGVLPFVSTLLGGYAVFRLRHRLHVAMAAAAGILVATALVDLIPESIELIGTDDAALIAGIAAVVGYLLYATVEAFVHQASYEHEHDPHHDPDTPHEHARRSSFAMSTLVWLAPAGLIVHSVLDGFAIGLGFEAGPEVGVLVLLAVLVHDFADGLNIVTVAFAAGRGRGGALVLLALDAVAAMVGIVLSQVFVLTPEQLGILLGAFGGAFIAIGAGHLLPEAEHRQRENGHRGSAGVSPLIALAIAGAVVVLVTRTLIA
jgi:ZIP family zinc transporter